MPEKKHRPEEIAAKLLQVDVLVSQGQLVAEAVRSIGAFVDYYNNRRYHESLGNLTPADVHHGRGAQIMKAREEIKKRTIRQRRLQPQIAAV